MLAAAFEIVVNKNHHHHRCHYFLAAVSWVHGAISQWDRCQEVVTKWTVVDDVVMMTVRMKRA